MSKHIKLEEAFRWPDKSAEIVPRISGSLQKMHRDKQNICAIWGDDAIIREEIVIIAEKKYPPMDLPFIVVSQELLVKDNVELRN